MMNERGKSDRPVVPVKSSNKAGQPAAEGMEGRGLAKGNPQQQNASRTQSRTTRPVRWSGYVKQQARIRRCGSPRSLTTFTPGSVAHGLSLLEERSRTRRGRRDVAALRRGP